MSAVAEYITVLPKGNQLQEVRKNLVKKMVINGIQVPLTKLLTKNQIKDLNIREHVLFRYKQRFQLAYDIQIETDIKAELLEGAMVVKEGYSGRWLVYSKGYIFVLDETDIYTTYDANGNDKNNIVDPTRATMQRVKRKTKNIDRIDYLLNNYRNN